MKEEPTLEQDYEELTLEELRFEVWAGPRGYNLHRIRGKYNHNSTWCAWDAWSYRALFSERQKP